MSDEKNRIEELEQQLKIAKLEKELAEMKAEKSELGRNVNEQEEPQSFAKAEIIESYINEKFLKTDCILVGENLTNEIIVQSGMKISNDEKPLLLLYKKSLFYDLKTRILITNKNIYFKALPDTFLIGLTCNFAKKVEGKFDLEKIRNLEIADHDHAFGSAYIGHQLKINNDVVGLIRMGSNTEFDEEAIKYLNNLFNELTRQNSLNSKTETIPNTAEEKSSNEEVSDSWQTIAWKLGLALIGAIILSTLFPNIFSDKIVVTNPYTGEQIEFPVETTTIDGEENYCINISILKGAERTFCSADKEALSNFTAKVKEQEAKMITEMAFRGQSVSSETTKLFSLDNIIYAGPKNHYHIYEQSSETEQSNLRTEEQGDIIDMSEDEYNHIVKESQKEEEKQVSKPVQQSIQPKQQPVSQPKKTQATVQSNAVTPQAKSVQTQQQDQYIDDFMN